MAIANTGYFTSEDLIESIKTRGQIPDTQNMIDENGILRLANEEMKTTLIPLVLTRHQSYYLVKEIIPFVANQKRYDIPSRAIASKIREVSYISDLNNEHVFREMNQIPVDDISQYPYSTSVNHFYIEDDQIVIHSDTTNINPNAGICVHYFQRPNSLVLSERVGIITNIDRTSGTITLSAMPENFSSNELFDFIRTKSPHKILDYDVPVININTISKLITLDPEYIPDSLIVGDRISMAGETNLINAPTELHPLLAQMTCSLVLESIGDNQNLVLAEQRLKKMENNAATILDNRVLGSPIKAKRRNSPLRNKSLRRRHGI